MNKKNLNIQAQFNLEKITISGGIKKLIENNAQAYKLIESDLIQITLQKPKFIYTKSNSDRFKLKINELNAFKITIRGKNLKFFLNQLKLALMQDKEFNGINLKSMDNNCNTVVLGIKRQEFFLSIDRTNTKLRFGFYVTFTFNSNRKAINNKKELIHNFFISNGFLIKKL